MGCKWCGSETECDCEERINCDKVGETGHYNCGICSIHNKPRFQCGCLIYKIGEQKMRLKINPKFRVGANLYLVVNLNITKIKIHSIITETIENTKFYYLIKPFNSPKVMKTNDESSMFIALVNAKQLAFENLNVAIDNTRKQIEKISEKDFVVKEEKKSE